MADGLQSFINLAEKDVQAFVATVENDTHILLGEGRKLIAWVDAEIPGAQAAMAVLVQDGEAAAQLLEQYAQKGFGDAITAGEQELEEYVGNFINASGLAPNVKTAINAAVVAGGGTAKDILTALVTKVLVKVLAAGAPAIAAAL